jgi:hypothetical protein
MMADEVSNPLRLAVGEARLDEDTLSFDVAQLPQPGPERVEKGTRKGRRAVAEERYPGSRRGPLGVDPERYGEEDARQGTDERPSIHHSIT